MAETKFLEKITWDGREWHLVYIPGNPRYSVPAFGEYQIINRDIIQLPPPFSTPERPQYFVWVQSRRNLFQNNESQDLFSFQIYDRKISMEVNAEFCSRAPQMIAYLSPNEGYKNAGYSFLMAALGLKEQDSIETGEPKPLLTSDTEFESFAKQIYELNQTTPKEEAKDTGPQGGVNEEAVK